MDKKKLVQRHDLLTINIANSKILLEELVTTLVPEELILASEILQANYPAIVRREFNYLGKDIPCGFVHPFLQNGRRYRLGVFIPPHVVEKIITPYEVFTMDFSLRNNCLLVLKKIVDIAQTLPNITLGILGSAGLEIYTREKFTHNNSDLDLLVKNCSYQEISQLYSIISNISEKYSVTIDLEIELSNGYGIKAAELLMDTKLILGKSLEMVTLLERTTVMKLLKE